MKVRASFLHLALLAAFLLPGFCSGARAAVVPGSGTAPQGDFFIIASVNRQKNEFFLKAPTEVTELMRVDDKTVFLNQQGKRVQLSDLHAGATVYVVSRPDKSGEPVASRMQEGPMTPAVLHERYTSFN